MGDCSVEACAAAGVVGVCTAVGGVGVVAAGSAEDEAAGAGGAAAAESVGADSLGTEARLAEPVSARAWSMAV